MLTVTETKAPDGWVVNPTAWPSPGRTVWDGVIVHRYRRYGDWWQCQGCSVTLLEIDAPLRKGCPHIQAVRDYEKGEVKDHGAVR